MTLLEAAFEIILQNKEKAEVNFKQATGCEIRQHLCGRPAIPATNR